MPRKFARLGSGDLGADVFGDLGGCVPELLAACPRAVRRWHEDVCQVELPAWHQGRVVLVGNAAHAASRVAGQGVSLAMASAFVLAEELQAGPDPRAAFARHEARLRPVVAERQAAGRRFARAFLAEAWPRQEARDFALRMAGHGWAEYLLEREPEEAGPLEARGV